MVERPDDADARGDMLAAAVLGGRCLQNASMGVHHGLSQLVGGRTGIAHGLANAVILPHAIRFNEPAVPEAVAKLAAALGVDDLAGAVADLVRRIGLPTQLGDCGVSLEDLEAVASAAPGNGNVANNPRPVGVDEAHDILTAAY